MNIFGILANGVSGLIAGFFETKKAEQKAAQERAAKQQEMEATWENTQADASKTSWKDEWWTIVFSIPLIMAFIPSMAEYALNGFEIISTMPSWYQYTTITIALASFGIRGIGHITDKIKGK